MPYGEKGTGASVPTEGEERYPHCRRDSTEGRGLPARCLQNGLGLSTLLTDPMLIFEAAAEVRLEDGGGRCAGRVEVKHQGQWGTVCGVFRDMKAAAVVCKQLSCGSALKAHAKGHFGAGSGPVWIVRCRGTESALSDCTHNPWGQHNCVHGEDAGVTCSGKGSARSLSLGLGQGKGPGCALREKLMDARAGPGGGGHSGELGLSLLVSPVPGERAMGALPGCPQPAPRWLSPPLVSSWGWEMNLPPCPMVSLGSHLSPPIQPGPA